MRTIKLRWSATCRDCGAALEVGDTARYYGRGRVYGVNCHDREGNRTETGEAATGYALAPFVNAGRDNGRTADEHPAHWPNGPGLTAFEQGDTSPGAEASHHDRTGFYSADGTCLGSQNPAGRCEDAPCCGCCS